MSVTFQILDPLSGDDARDYMNLSNANAAEIMGLLGVDLERLGWGGEIRGRDLRIACEKYLATHDENDDLELPFRQDGNFIDCGRRPGYRHEKVRALLAMARAAGELGMIHFC